jgi:hypothetical protein
MKRSSLIRLTLVLVISCAVIADADGQQSSPSAITSAIHAPPRTFAQVVKQYFSQWDKNSDGKLTPDEINAAVANPAFHDEAAAAIAAVKLVLRSGKYDLPPITQDYLVSSPLHEPAITNAPAKSQVLSAPPQKSDRPPVFQRPYRSALARLRKTSRDIFAESPPALAACHQGQLGDCYFVSVVGAMVDRDPAAVKALFTPNSDGSTTVAFGKECSVKIAPLTDAEIGISSTAGTNGLWLTVLENAYGKIRGEAQATNQQDEPDTDAIAHGGKPGAVINLLDGHQAIAYVLNDEHRRSPQFAAKLRQNLDAAQREHRLMEATTPADTQLPPGINSKHAYAILGYDGDTDMVRVWNPHGNNFTPKGPDSLQHGYMTKAGQFDIPLNDLLGIYSRVIIESQTLISH